MGCTPSSLHVHQSGVVRCSQDDGDASGHSQLIGVQGSFRATCDSGEGTSRETPIPMVATDEEDIVTKGSVFFQTQDAQVRLLFEFMD